MPIRDATQKIVASLTLSRLPSPFTLQINQLSKVRNLLRPPAIIFLLVGARLHESSSQISSDLSSERKAKKENFFFEPQSTNPGSVICTGEEAKQVKERKKRALVNDLVGEGRGVAGDEWKDGRREEVDRGRTKQFESFIIFTRRKQLKRI